MSLVEGKGAEQTQERQPVRLGEGWGRPDAEGEEAFPGGGSTGPARSSGHRRPIFLESCHLIKVSMAQNP